MPWSRPAARMREMVLAIRAIWDAWATDGALEFRGDFYTHTLMPPAFRPGANPFGTPRIVLAAVGDRMTEVTAEVADGMILHPFTTERYVREVTVPAIARGLGKAGRARSDFELSAPVFVVTGEDGEARDAAARAVKSQIAFYGSTPSYRGVLALHGWDDTAEELNRMSRTGEWNAMADRIDDEMLHAFAVVAEPDGVADALLARYGDLLDRVSLHATYRDDHTIFASTLARLASTGS
jgi:probable F420-dependent oxidoreductase